MPSRALKLYYHNDLIALFQRVAPALRSPFQRGFMRWNTPSATAGSWSFFILLTAAAYHQKFFI